MLDLEKQGVEQKLAASEQDTIPRSIAFDGDVIYIASSDALEAYDPEFGHLGSWRNTYLSNCNEICVYGRNLYVASGDYDAVLVFDLDERRFTRGLYIATAKYLFNITAFDPNSDEGPLKLSKLDVNSVYCDENGMYVTGAKSSGMLHFNGEKVNMAVELPDSTNNARPFRDGVLFNDTEGACLRYSGRGDGSEDRAFTVPKYDGVDPAMGQQGIARGLCALSGHVVAGGSMPATITLWDLAKNRCLVSVNLATGPGSAVYGIEVWPYG